MLLVITGCSSDDSGKSRSTKSNKKQTKTHLEGYGEYKPQLWVIENDSNKIYLFGSIHIGIKEMYPLPDVIMNAFKDSSVLAVENDVIKLESDLGYIDDIYQLCLSDDPIKDKLNEDEFNTLKNFFSKNRIDIEDASLSSYAPVFYKMLVEQLAIGATKYDYQKGVDRHLLRAAKDMKMEVKDIEDPYYTSTRLSQLPEETQLYLLREALKVISEAESETDKLFNYQFFVEYRNRGDDDAIPVSRALKNYDKETGEIMCFANVPQNSYIGLRYCDGKDVAATTGNGLKEITEKLTNAMSAKEGYEYSTVLVASCSLRSVFLADLKDTEGVLVKEMLPSNLVVSGIYGFGEIAPTSVANGRAVNRFHNATFTLCAL